LKGVPAVDNQLDEKLSKEFKSELQVTRCDLQATRQELETDLAAVEALT
jgi:ABC-type phosphate transport system auxiliary subunit